MQVHTHVPLWLMYNANTYAMHVTYTMTKSYKLLYVKQNVCNKTVLTIQCMHINFPYQIFNNFLMLVTPNIN